MGKTIEEKRQAEAEKMRKWRMNNPEKAKAALRKYRSANRDKCNERSREWRKGNPDLHKLACERWASKNKERVLELHRESYHRNSGKYNIRRKNWYQDNRTTYRIKEREKRIKTKERLITAMGGKCLECGIAVHFVAFDFHHPNSDKERTIGSLLNASSWEKLWNEASKCELVCSNCHRIIHFNKTTELLYRETKED